MRSKKPEQEKIYSFEELFDWAHLCPEESENLLTKLLEWKDYPFIDSTLITSDEMRKFYEMWEDYVFTFIMGLEYEDGKRKKPVPAMYFTTDHFRDFLFHRVDLLRIRQGLLKRRDIDDQPPLKMPSLATIGRFCKLLEVLEIEPRLKEETRAESYIKRICQDYGLNYGPAAKTSGYSIQDIRSIGNKDLIKIRDLILPHIKKATAEAVGIYIANQITPRGEIFE